MTFHSILNILSVGDAKAETSEPPACFADLNLDQIVASITAGKQEYDLEPFFYEPLKGFSTLFHSIVRASRICSPNFEKRRLRHRDF
jgi:DNA mismatch repair protein MutS